MTNSFESIGGAEDGEFILRVAASGKSAFCKTSLARVRRHAGNESADPLHVTMGSAHILEYASAHHYNAKKYHLALRNEANKLRLEFADKAFSKGLFDLARKMFQHDFQRSMGVKFRVKKAIIHLPEPLRNLVWRATQANSIGSPRARTQRQP